MNYLNITKYIYLLVGCIMAYDGFSKWNDESGPWLSFIFAFAAFFMFFFRNNFAKKFEARKKEQNLNNPQSKWS